MPTPLRHRLTQTLSRHPQHHLQGAWNLAQVGLFIFPWFPPLGSLAILLALIGTWRHEYPTIIRRPLNWGLAILGIWLIITCCFALDPVTAFLGLGNFLPFFALFAAFSELIQTPAQLRHLAWILMLPVIPIVILGIGQQFLGWSTPEQLIGLGIAIPAGGNPEGRMSSLFMYANVLAAYLILVFALGIGLLIETVHRLREHPHRAKLRQLVFLSTVLISSAIAIILINSRNAWGIAFVICLAFAIYLGWYWILIAIAAAAGSVLWAAFGPTFGREPLRRIVPAFFWARLNDQLHSDRPVEMMRITQWQFTWSMTQQRPWVGWGLRNFTAIYEEEMALWLGHPHNLFLMLMAEAGIPATLLLCMMVGWIMAMAVRLLNVWSAVAPLTNRQQWYRDQLIIFSYLVAFSCCILFNLLDVTLYDVRINTLGWLLLSALCGIIYRYRRLLLWQQFKQLNPHNNSV